MRRDGQPQSSDRYQVFKLHDVVVDTSKVTDETIAVEEQLPKIEFSIARKGYDPTEVDEHLADFDVAFRELEEYAARLKHELAEAKFEIARLEESEQASIDSAMLAVFDAKERIIERANRKAQEIEDLACAAAVQILAEAGGSPDGGGVPEVSPDKMVESIRLDVDQVIVEGRSPARFEAPTPTDGPEPDEILQQVLREADTIRRQLDAGMSAALAEIDRLQRDAEDRAAALLDQARFEARQLRSAATGSGSETETIRDVTTAPGATSARDEFAERPERERQSRYSRNSAKLPRIGNDGGVSVIAKMNDLRKKLSDDEKDASGA